MARRSRPRDSAAAVRAKATASLRAPEFYLNRELSWLEFNRRVLEEALDESNPLLERVKFLAIFSSNLDEFFMIRVAGLRGQIITGESAIGRDGTPPAQLMAAIKLLVSDLSRAQRRCWHDDVLPKLRAEGIHLEQYHDLPARDRRALNDYFQRQIFPVLTPLAVDSSHPFPHISNLSVNMLIVLHHNQQDRIARMKIPTILPRFIRVPDEHARTKRQRFVLIEDLIEANVGTLFPGHRVKATHIFRLTRDADLEFEESGENLMKAIEVELQQRLFGFVVRLTVEPTMPQDLRDWLAEQLAVVPEDIYELDRPHGLSDLMQLYGAVDRPDLKDPPLTAQYPPVLRDDTSILNVMRQQDVLMYHPYDSFSAVVDFIREAATDHDVVAMKQTLYRVGSQSPIVDALRNARDDDTQVAVLVELRARFDEESNIAWARRLEREGVHVSYGLSGLKTHSKIAMVVRREGDHLRRYLHLGTGNYNVSTARLYTDIGLLTADPDIGADVSDVFNLLTGYSMQQEFRKLLVAPVNMREKLTALIEREMAHGADGRIILKMNSLSDYGMIEQLYRAARAGVRIDLIIRGICCLRPGIPGLSESIRVVSILGRFLEHARLFYFAHGNEDGSECLYSGSADMMRRNLDYRVEVLFPIEDQRLLGLLRDDVLELQLRDNLRARELQSDGSYRRLAPGDGDLPLDAQAAHLAHGWGVSSVLGIVGGAAAIAVDPTGSAELDTA